MLTLRILIVSSLFGVALWGLFALLENLREPELLRSTKAVIVKGCDPMESENAVELCPQLFCQKALLDARAFELRSRFEVTTDQQVAAQHLVGGTASNRLAERLGHFACVIEHGAVVTARAVTPEELDELSGQNGGWALSP